MNGVVQGVGFRPFVYNLAKSMRLQGWVRNSSAGVDIEIEGSISELEFFISKLNDQAPPLSRIEEITTKWLPIQGFKSFEIVHSDNDPNAFVPISPDVTICEDCLFELFNPIDRRFRYPFINCTNCGPRFTIIKNIPYDRPFTTMSDFQMCPACAKEYTDPADRRFHAQPIACPECGPQIWLEYAGKVDRVAEKEEALHTARKMLIDGKILAIKGLGGFHLACDATNSEAVANLRQRKLRVDKPFALMMPDIASIREYCQLSGDEKSLLESLEHPIVIIDQVKDTGIASEVAPGQTSLGVMLPYTPLHTLLIEPGPNFPNALVMTSGNISEEPLAYSNEEARERLSSLADAFLLHDRDIFMRCDDSVVRALPDINRKSTSKVYPIRRGRGYSPYPVQVPWEMPAILATGAELKNTFCLSKNHYAFMSHHIGDLENYETLNSFEQGISHFQNLFRIQPEFVAYDLHPNYLSTRYALARSKAEGLPAYGIQHHHAHIAACMAENHLTSGEQVIGLAFDGTGYGTDGTIWGGEVLLASYKSFQRIYHLKSVGLPGGDLAIKEPWRMAISWLHSAGIHQDDSLPCCQGITQEQIEVMKSQIENQINVTPTSSMGRFFDAIAALIGVKQIVNYEAQAAIELESIADPDEKGLYRFEVKGGIIDPTEMIHQIIWDIRKRTPLEKISAIFHNSIAELTLFLCLDAKRNTGTNNVALSGGVWQNMSLLQQTLKLLKGKDFNVYVHRKVPTNDGGLALGQAVIAYHSMND